MKLSRIIPSKVRTVIPVYFNENGNFVSDEIKIYNPTQEQLKEIREEILNKNSDEIFLILLEKLTDIEVDRENIDDFNNFFKYFNEACLSLQAELLEILTEITSSSYELIKKFSEIPDDKKAQYVTLNPIMEEAFEEIKNLTKIEK